jgi:hypothetical protein
MTVTHDSDGERLLFSDEIYFDIKISEDTLAYIQIRRDADGSSFEDARARAGNIAYSFTVDGNWVTLDDYLTTPIENKVRDQEVRVNLMVPEGTVLMFDDSAEGHLGRGTRYDEDLYRSEVTDYHWVMQADGKIRCLNCPEDVLERETNSGDGHIIIDEEGVDIDLKDNGDTFKMQIDEKGVRIKSGGQP